MAFWVRCKAAARFVWSGWGNLVWFAGLVGVSTLTALAAEAAGIMAQNAPFSYFVIGIITAAALALISLLWALSRSIHIRANARREQLRNADNIDPMQDIFQNKRIMLTDLVNPFDQVVLNKKFIRCELIGPANIIPLLNGGKFQGNNFTATDSVEMRDDVIPMNAIAFANCDFEECKFFKVTLLWQTKARKQADVIITGLHWLTEIDEPALPKLLEGPKQKGFFSWLKKK